MAEPIGTETNNPLEDPRTIDWSKLPTEPEQMAALAAQHNIELEPAYFAGMGVAPINPADQPHAQPLDSNEQAVAAQAAARVAGAVAMTGFNAANPENAAPPMPGMPGAPAQLPIGVTVDPAIVAATQPLINPLTGRIDPPTKSNVPPPPMTIAAPPDPSRTPDVAHMFAAQPLANPAVAPGAVPGAPPGAVPPVDPAQVAAAQAAAQTNPLQPQAPADPTQAAAIPAAPPVQAAAAPPPTATPSIDPAQATELKRLQDALQQSQAQNDLMLQALVANRGPDGAPTDGAPADGDATGENTPHKMAGLPEIDLEVIEKDFGANVADSFRQMREGFGQALADRDAMLADIQGKITARDKSHDDFIMKTIRDRVNANPAWAKALENESADGPDGWRYQAYLQAENQLFKDPAWAARSAAERMEQAARNVGYPQGLELPQAQGAAPGLAPTPAPAAAIAPGTLPVAQPTGAAAPAMTPEQIAQIAQARVTAAIGAPPPSLSALQGGSPPASPVQAYLNMEPNARMAFMETLPPDKADALIEALHQGGQLVGTQ